MSDICKEILDILEKRKMKLSMAESLTGGMIGGRIVDVPGASRAFVGSAVTYSDEAKINVLGVSKDTIKKYTAVSKETAQEMAEGSVKLYGSDVAVSATGIAGPGGYGKEYPEGLVYIGVYVGGECTVYRHVFDGGRQSVREKTVTAALGHLLDKLKEN